MATAAIFANNDCHGNRNRSEPRANILNHVAFRPGSFSLWRATQRIFNYLLTEFD
jgi:hypothetical protein